MTASSDVNSRVNVTPESTSEHNDKPALTLYGKMLTFTRIKLNTANLEDIDTQLATLLSNKDSKIPVLIDSDVEQDLPVLLDLLWSWGLQPIGVVAGILETAAADLRLAVFPAEGKRIARMPVSAKPVSETRLKVASIDASSNNKQDNTDTQDPQNETQTNEIHFTGNDRAISMIYDQMLRSGQSVNHVGGDLIITNSVNNGAEAISDNCLHIYGRAQGRLVAGATGDKEARIFCQRFNPSLVSVAGTYCLNDNIPAEFIDQPVQVSFEENEGLVFEILNKT